MLSDGLAMISDSAFFYVVPYDRQLVEAPDMAYITCLLWAQSPGAALRAMEMQLERDDGSIRYDPPVELLLSPDSVTYHGILQHARSQVGNSVMEHAGYRATDGAFIHRTISVGSQFKFYFRGRAERDDERPYAIRYKERRVA